MNDAWFRRAMGFGYVPITWQGWMVLAAMLGVFLPFALLFLYVAEPAASWGFASVAALAAIAGHVVIICKFERR